MLTSFLPSFRGGPFRAVIPGRNVCPRRSCGGFDSAFCAASGPRSRRRRPHPIARASPAPPRAAPTRTSRARAGVRAVPHGGPGGARRWDRAAPGDATRAPSFRGLRGSGSESRHPARIGRSARRAAGIEHTCRADLAVCFQMTPAGSWAGVVADSRRATPLNSINTSARNLVRKTYSSKSTTRLKRETHEDSLFAAPTWTNSLLSFAEPVV